ncbi:MAG: hypothetical protein KUG82_00810 [Pseudomonadales bacterium]|nr:hypothetical protein [Pseudomonadales bacterium]
MNIGGYVDVANQGVGTYQTSSVPSFVADGESSSSLNQDNQADDLANASETVSISDAARLAATAGLANGSTEYYEQFFPTYEGFSSANVAAGVSDPSLETFSAGKSFDQVAIDARASLDNNYERLASIGKPYNAGSSQPEDKNSLIGELDRRALYAVASNEGGLFTKEEQSVATGKMRSQQGLAMGLYSGPTSEKGKFIDPFFGDRSQQFKAGIQFLHQVSNEEKAGSIEFAVQRASLQRSYEAAILDKGGVPEDFSTDHPLVNLILAARDSVNGDLQRGQTFGVIENTNDLRRQPWFEGFSGHLDNAIQESRRLYLGNN